MFVGSNLSSQTMSESSLREIYVSTDIETDGPVAGKHSMLSIGSAAYLADKELLGTFSANLETLPASVPDPKTAAWWATQPQAWSACRQNPEAPAVALKRYVAWLKAFGGRPVFVGYPAAFDFSFVYWYLAEFAGENRCRNRRTCSGGRRSRAALRSSRRGHSGRRYGRICRPHAAPGSTPHAALFDPVKLPANAGVGNSIGSRIPHLRCSG